MLGFGHFAFSGLLEMAAGAGGDFIQVAVVLNHFLGQGLEQAGLQGEQLLGVFHAQGGLGVLLRIGQGRLGGDQVQFDELLHAGESLVGQADQGFEVGLVGRDHLFRGQSHVHLQSKLR